MKQISNINDTKLTKAQNNLISNINKNYNVNKEKLEMEAKNMKIKKNSKQVTYFLKNIEKINKKIDAIDTDTTDIKKVVKTLMSIIRSVSDVFENDSEAKKQSLKRLIDKVKNDKVFLKTLEEILD